MALADSNSFSVFVSNEFDGLTDRGHTLVSVVLPAAPSVHFRCGGGTAQITGSLIVVNVLLDEGVPQTAACQSYAVVDVGPLDIGQYSIVAKVVTTDGTEVATLSAGVDIRPRPPLCNENPFAAEIIATPTDKTPAEFVAAFNGDPVFRAHFGDIGQAQVASTGTDVALRFPPLSDPVVEADAAERTGEFRQVQNPSFVCNLFVPFAPDATVVEFHDTVHDRYFMSADAAEQAAVDAGGAGPGWVRTGHAFRVPTTGLPCGFEAPVYRFTGVPDVGPASHFFTAQQDECAVVRDRADWHWQFEGVAFWALRVPAGGCGGDMLPTGPPPYPITALYRAYNNGNGGPETEDAA